MRALFMSGKETTERQGVKFDQGKSPLRRGLIEYFPRACLEVAKVSEFGASKYAWEGWRSVPDALERYGDAGMRHAAYAAISATDDESGLLHAAHEAWNAMARLEMLLEDE
jgi:hypothetical protein